MSIPHPGVSEIGFLADIKQVAERIATEVFGTQIRWEVEAVPTTTSKRPDVVVKYDHGGEVIASGEAKRPDTPKGIHPLVASEVRDAIQKAQTIGAPLCFTTNFFEAAILDASRIATSSDYDRLQGGLLTIVPNRLASAPNWWQVLAKPDQERQVALGLRQLFERIKAIQSGPVPRDIDEIALFVFSRTTQRLVDPLAEALIAQRDLGPLPPSLLGHMLRVQLDPSEDAELRFLVAQGVAEVLTAILFYRNISDNFSLPPLLGGTNPAKTKPFNRTLGASLTAAITASGDYETIFRLSPAAEWVLNNGGPPALEHWKDLVGFAEQIDFTAVSSDVIGSIFERLISPERRHEMGQHYTDARIARSMTAWAVRSADRLVADIACGGGTFLVAAHRILANAGVTHAQILQQVFGNDIDPFAVHLSTVNMATREVHRGTNYPVVRLGDAFSIRPGEKALEVHPFAGGDVELFWPTEGFDAIVGNPPYAGSPDDPSALKAALGRLGSPAPAGMDGGNLAAWFMLLSAALAKRASRIALVMPTAALQNSNLSQWRTWLRSQFDVVVWHTEDDVWFSDARVAVCVILAERPASAPPTLHFVNLLERTNGDLCEVGSVPSPVQFAHIRDLSDLRADKDILVAGTYPSELLAFASAPGTETLENLLGVTVFSGNKLGHGFFQLRDLSPGKPSAILRHVEGIDMQFKLSRKYLTPLLSGPKDERTGEFSGCGWWILTAPDTVPSRGALRDYVRHGEALGVHEAPSVSQRGSKWWSVHWRKSNIAVQIHPGFLHQVWWSPNLFIAKNNFEPPRVWWRLAHLSAASVAGVV